jgi:methylamine---glutamate N-methyltransferase subunit B
MAPVGTAPAVTVDLRASSTRQINELLASADAPKSMTITNPQGAHALACGLDADLDVTIEGHVGYYCAGMNKHASVTVNGNAGVGVAENMMSGTVRIAGDASQSAGATAHGGLLVIEGNAAARCGISMKGVDIVVGGNIGHMSAFMGQAGRLVVCGNAGEALGDSLYEARLYVRGKVASLGADCVEKPMRAQHLAELKGLLDAAGFDADPAEFTRYGSARNLYNFHVDNASAY